MNIKNNKGFTLIEVIVVMGVFLFIVGAAISIFISVVQNQKKVLAEQQLINQISYVEEYMSKALRMAATDMSPNGDCVPNGYIYLLTRPDTEENLFRGVRFLNQSTGDCQEFFLDVSGANGPVLKELKGSSGRKVPLENESANATEITSLNLEINEIKFSINGSGGSTFSNSASCEGPEQCGASNKDKIQPRLTIVFNIKVAGDSQQPDRIIQSTVSQRNLNVYDAEQ
ncbi:MAG: type II secretion system protein [Candidatus Staskawiczbacteria bacterium]|jgi:prepilin-type N-terminal cleavage/methylation domain-containing protein